VGGSQRSARRAMGAPLRVAAFAFSAVSASILTSAIPSFVGAVMNPSARTLLSVTFPVEMGLLGGLDIWLALALAWLIVRTERPQLDRVTLGLTAGILAGGLYVLAAFLMAPLLGVPRPHSTDEATSHGLGALLTLTPFVQAKMISLHQLFGWKLIDPPLGWVLVISPIPACAVGGLIYGALTRRHDRAATAQA